MELKLDKTTKILLGAIALGLFLNASDVYIKKAHAYYSDYTDIVDLNVKDLKKIISSACS